MNPHGDRSSILLASARAGARLQGDDGAMPPGHNGPWQTADTPVRVTAHWILVFLHAQGLGGDAMFGTAADKGCDYLLSESIRPGGASFLCCRSGSENTRVNGLIGQAWAVEALLAAGQALGRGECLDLAERLMLRHEFDARIGLWHGLGISGNILPVHASLNQQIWFCLQALALCRLRQHPGLLAQARDFVSRLPRIVAFNGRYIDMLISDRSWLRQGLRSWLRVRRRKWRKGPRLAEEGIGYVSFTLLGLALLHGRAPELGLWRDAKLRRAAARSIRFLEELAFRAQGVTNPFLFSYNPTGFEMATVVETLSPLGIEAQVSPEEWVRAQLDRHYRPETGLMDRNTSDPLTLAARVYELIYWTGTDTAEARRT